MTALRTPNFRRLWLAGLVSDTGDWLLLASLPIVVYQFTGSTLGTAAAFLVELIPPVLLAPIVGRIADRWDRRRTLMIVSLLQALALIPLLFVHARSDLPIVYVVIALQAALVSAFDPTKNALLPTLVADDELVSANSLIGLNQNIGRLVGAPIGGVLLAIGGGLTGVVAVDAVSFLVAVGLIGRLTTVPRNEPSADVAAAALAEPPRGLRAALAGRVIRGALATLLLASVAQGLFVVLFVVFVARELHGESTEIGTLRGVQAIGAIAGGLLLAVASRIAPGRLTAISALAFGLVDLTIWNAPRLTTAMPIYVVLFIAAGVPGVAMMTGLLSVVQRAAPDGRRGTVFAAFGVAASVGQAVGMIGGGVLGDRFGVVAVLNGQGVLYLLAGLVAAQWITRAAMPVERQPVSTPGSSPLLRESSAGSAPPQEQLDDRDVDVRPPRGQQ